MISRLKELMDDGSPPVFMTEDVFHRVAELVERLAVAVASKSETRCMFMAVERELSFTPMAADEFALISARLGNIRQYIHRGEHGAAVYELRLMARCLAK
jgi:hypothetical protein